MFYISLANGFTLTLKKNFFNGDIFNVDTVSIPIHKNAFGLICICHHDLPSIFDLWFKFHLKYNPTIFCQRVFCFLKLSKNDLRGELTLLVYLIIIRIEWISKISLDQYRLRNLIKNKDKHVILFFLSKMHTYSIYI